MDINVGVVGFSDTKFDVDFAKAQISDAFDFLETISSDKKIRIVSGLTSLGIPKLAYEEAAKRDWETVGIACSDAKNYECFPVDETHIVGSEWGDESETFLKYCDLFFRFGGGKQSLEEIAEAKKMGKKVFEYNIPNA